MDPFTLWLLGSVVAPDAYQRVIDSLRADSAGHRLGARVRKQVGRFPRATFRKWYSTEATWQELIAGGEQSYTSLVGRLIECSQGRWLRQPLSRPRAEEIVRAAVASFVGSLDPSDAVAVADHRSAERDAAIDSNAEARTNALRGHLDGRLDSIESHLTGRESFDERLSLLPAVVRPLLLTIGASPEAVKLLDIGVADVPREGLVQLTADLPPWLRDASSETLFAAAELCRSYGVHLGAGRLFELAAAGAADRAYCYARSAVEYSTVGEADRSAELIASASSLASTNAVRAIAAALAEEPASVLEALPEGEALADPYFVVLRLYGLRATRQVEEVIAFLESALTCYPESPGLMIELAWALLQRSQGTTTSRSADRHRAIELGLQARQLRRDWRADAADAARVACQAALLLSNYGLVIEIGMPPPDGEAMPMEAANTEVRLSVAQAAIAAGRTELLSTVVELVPDGFHRSIIQAEFLLTTGADIADLQAAYDVVWQTATAEEHRVLYWLSGSAAGVELQGEEEMRARADDVPLMVDSQLRMAQGDHAEAVRLLRQGSRTEQTTRLLVGALVAMDDLDGAVDELRAAATRFNDPLHLVRAVEVLGRGGRIADASQLAQESLHRVPRAMPDARSFLHEVLVEQAGIDESWGEMAIRSRAWIDDLGPSPQNRWHLALALHNSGDRLGAWRTLQDNPRLRPDSAPRARLWVVIAAHEDPSPDTAREIISLIDEHPDDTLLAGAAVATFFGRGDDVWGDVDAETVRRFQELLTQNAAPYGSDEDATVYVLTGSPEEMLDSLRPSLEANARAVAEMTEKVRQGWPYGLLAAAGSRPYCATLIHRAAGFYPIATTDPGRQEAEVDAARAAIGGTISLDVSGLVIASHTRSEWPRLRGAFARIELARPAQVDILETVEDFRRPSHASVFFDSASQAVRGADTDPEIQARLLDHGEWVLGQVPDLVVVDWPRLTHLSDELDDVFLPWLTPLDMAKSRGLPLWCDDVGLRTLAINDGVPAFGTPALLSVLVERGDFDPAQARAFLRRLREAYAVDLPLDADWLRLSAGSDEWRAGPSAFYFARAAAWVDFHTTYELWSELAQAAADAEPVRVAGWLHAAALGLVSAVDAERSVHVLAGIAAKAAVLAEFDPEAIAALMALAEVPQVCSSKFPTSEAWSR